MGDVDIVTPEHLVSRQRILPKANLAIIPMSDHFMPVARGKWILPMLQELFAREE